MCGIFDKYKTIHDRVEEVVSDPAKYRSLRVPIRWFSVQQSISILNTDSSIAKINNDHLQFVQQRLNLDLRSFSFLE
jgi:hypothetical protein